MKLRNKKTGEIIFTDFELSISIPDKEKLYGCDTYTQIKGYSTLKDLVEEWEDYREPKTAWFIDPQGDIQEWRDVECDDWTKEKAIGNYFESKEEAEQAVEKLKAWKRLKDKGFRFEYVEEYENLCGNGVEIPIMAIMPPENYTDIETVEDLNLLFSQEDD